MAANNFPQWLYDGVNPPILVQSLAAQQNLQSQGVYTGNNNAPPTPSPLPNTSPPSPYPTFVFTPANSALTHSRGTGRRHGSNEGETQ